MRVLTELPCQYQHLFELAWAAGVTHEAPWLARRAVSKEAPVLDHGTDPCRTAFYSKFARLSRLAPG